MQAVPTASGQVFSSRNVFGIELPFVERTFHDDRLKRRIDDELGQHRIAAKMPFGSLEQAIWLDLANHIAEIEVAVGEVFDVLAAPTCSGARC